MFKSIKLHSVTAVMLLAMLSGQAKAVPVDQELSLLVDVSGSVSAGGSNLQRQGYMDRAESAELLHHTPAAGRHQ